MKKIIRYLLVILCICVIYGLKTHEHEFLDIVHYANYYEFDYIEHICDCGYSYNDHCVNSTKCCCKEKVEQELEEEKNKQKVVLASIKTINFISSIDTIKEIVLVKFEKQVIEKEKVYIIFFKFKGSI